MTKRALALLLVMAMVLSFIPVVATAETEAAAPSYTMTVQKAHNQAEKQLAIDIYLQAGTADQGDVTGYQFTATPAEGLSIVSITDVTGNDGIAGSGNTFVYNPAIAPAIAVGTSRVLVATIVLTGDTLPATAAEALALSAVTVSKADGFFSNDSEDATATGYLGQVTVVNVANACTESTCGHESGEWKTLPAIAENGGISLAESGNYYLTEDTTAFLYPQKNVTINLCLNGYDLIAPAGKKCILIEKTGVNFTICDCTATGEGVDYSAGRLVPNHSWGGAIDVAKDAGANVTMLGGIIDGSGVDCAAGSKAGNGVYLRGGNNKFTAKGVLFVGLEGYTNKEGAFYGPNIFRGAGTEGYFENCTFVDCGTAIIDANDGTGSVKKAVKLTVKDCVITDSQAGAHAIDVKHTEFASVTIEGNCQFDVPVYIADGEKPVILNLGAEADVDLLTVGEKTEAELNAMLTIPENATLPEGTVLYENAAAYLTYANGAIAFSSHSHDNVSFKVWTDPNSLPNHGNYYLDTDVTLSYDIVKDDNEANVVIGKDQVLNLDLNGHTIRVTGTARAFNVTDGGVLSIYDCQEGYDAEGNWVGGQITGSTNKYGAIRAYRSQGTASTVNLYGGRISGNGFRDDDASVNGAALYLYSDRSTKNAETGVITTSEKGAVFNMFGGEICNNYATYAGAVVATWGNDNSLSQEYAATFNVYGGKIHGNHSGTHGNIYLTANAVANIYGGVFEGNTTDTYGAVVHAGSANCTLNVEGGTFKNNAAAENAGLGGVIYADRACTITVKNATFTKNTAYQGGAIYLKSGASVTIEDCVFDSNAAADNKASSAVNGGSGGAVFVAGAATEVEIIDSTFTKNTAYRKNTGSDYAGFGGAILNDGGQLIVDGCTFTENSTNRNGGAIGLRANGGSTTIKNSTLSGNQADGVGGAIYQLNQHALRLEDTTITNNSTKNNGAVYVTSQAATLTVSGQVIIAGNVTHGSTYAPRRDLFFQENTVELKDADGNPVYETKDGVATKNKAKITDPRENMIFVDELESGSRINAYYHKQRTNYVDGAYVYDVRIAADVAVQVAENKTQTDWDCGWVTVYQDYNETGDTVGRAEGVFTYGHIHTINGQAVTFQPLSSTTVPKDGNYYYLTKNVTGNITANGDINLCFNGHTVTTKSSGRGMVISNSATVNIYDCTAYYNPDGTYVSGGFTGAQYQNYGGAIRIEGGTSSDPTELNWYGGAIFGCTRTYPSSGSGLVIFSKNDCYANINWYDGAIHDNTASKAAGSCTGLLCLQGTTELTIHNIAYYNNYNDGLGGIYNSTSKNVTVKGGNFWNNTASRGAVFREVKKLIIEGGNFWGNTAVIDGGVISNCANVTIKGGKFYDNQGPSGGVIITSGTLTIEDGEFYGNQSTGGNGGVVYTSGTLTIKGGSFHDNVAGVQGSAEEAGVQGNGGALYISGNSNTITGGTFQNNIAYGYGGAICQSSSANVLNITGTEGNPILFKGNQAIRYYKATTTDGVTTIALDSDAGMGGAIKLNNGTINADYVTMEGNHAYEGGAYCMSDGTGNKWITNFNHTTFKDNTALVWGGAVALENGTVNIQNSVFENNEATTAGYAKGGAIYSNPNGTIGSGESAVERTVTATVENCDFINNDSAYESGAISILRKSYFTFNDCDFTGNQSEGAGGVARTENAATDIEFNRCNFTDNLSRASSGGALALRYIGTANMNSCTFTNNSAAKAGGVFYISGSSTGSEWNSTDCVFTGNSAGTSGGVAYIEPSGQSGAVRFIRCQMTDNSAVNNGGAIQMPCGEYKVSLTLEDTVIQNNTSANYGTVAVTGSANATVYLKGATVISDNICEAAEANGNGLYFAHKTVVNAENERVPSNVNMDASGLTDGAHIDIAVSDIRFESDPVISCNGSGAQKDYFFNARPDAMMLGTALVGESEELCFYRYIDENGSYATIQAYVDAQPADAVVQIPMSTDETLNVGSRIIDLNGKTLGKIVVAESETVKLIDSKTNDYDVADGDYAKVIVEGDFVPYVEINDGGTKRYVVLANEDGTVSAHRIYLAINAKVLRPANNGVGFKAIFAGDQVVEAAIDGYGLQMRKNSDAFGDETTYLAADFADKGFTAGLTNNTPNQITVVLKNIVTTGNADNQSNFETNIYGRPYITIGDLVITGNVVNTNMNDLVKYAKNNGNAAAQAAAQNILDTFGVVVK